jgi:23S rRNA C2498 (ribose-2'-O)-methylase RlmM
MIEGRLWTARSWTENRRLMRTAGTSSLGACPGGGAWRIVRARDDDNERDDNH